jgi:TadE-like protein.
MRGAVATGRGERGSVTAEFATVVPAVLLVLACCLGGVQTVAQQLRLTDAAADAARSLARGDDTELAAAHVRNSVGAARMSTETKGDFVCVRLTSAAAFAPATMVGFTVAGRGCALGQGSG